MPDVEMIATVPGAVSVALTPYGRGVVSVVHITVKGVLDPAATARGLRELQASIESAAVQLERTAAIREAQQGLSTL